MKSPQASQLPYWLRQILCIISGASYIFILVFINLIGYAIGTNNLHLVIQKLVYIDSSDNTSGTPLLLITFYFLCWGVRLMFLIEEFQSSLQRRILKFKGFKSS